MNAHCRANYYDLKSSEAYPVTLSVEQDELHIVGNKIDMLWPMGDMRVSERLGSAPRTIRHATKGFCEISDLAAFDDVLKVLKHRPKLLELVQHNSWATLASALFFVGLLGLAYIVGLPAASKTIAMSLPQTSLTMLDSGTLEQLEKYGVLMPSKITKARQQELIAKFAKLVDSNNSDSKAKGSYNIVFRQSEAMGANAFALPSGTIVMLDDLAHLATDDNEIMGVLAHELGHVQARHAARMVLQTSTVGLAMTWWLGDVSTLLAAAPAAILGAKYSRDMEREADSYGIALMQRNGLSPCYLATMLDKLEANLAEKKLKVQVKESAAKRASDSHIKKESKRNKTSEQNKTLSNIGDYLASHPATSERMRALCPAKSSNSNLAPSI